MDYTDDSGFGSTPVAAGGSFKVWGGSSAAEDAKVHNVVGIAGLDISADTVNTSANNGVPGLGSANMNLLVSGSDDPAVLTCAGAYGCHGKVTDAGLTNSDTGIRGFHHGSTAYRYLNIATSGLAVAGDGDPNWEQLGTGSSRNIYSASTTVGINKLCANCHPDFHGNPNKGTVSNTSDGSSWIRHPTDNLLNVLSNVTRDYDNNPFAFVDISALTPGGGYTASTDGAAVACISCHRAHGTPYADILRWDYDKQNAGKGGISAGCLGCHYDQR